MPDIYHEFPILSSPAAIFAAITLPEHLINWWPLKCSGSPAFGTTYNFFFGPEYDWYGKVITCEENKSFHLKITEADPDWNSTSFGFDLSASENQTQLNFQHIDWPDCNHHFKSSSFCWAMLLNGLKNYLEKGIVVPFEQRN